MQNRERGAILAAMMVAVLGAGTVRADSGLVLRAVGFYQGRSQLSADSIRCEIPTVESAIPDGSFVLGLWNTFGVPTFSFPDVFNPVADPCGGWIQLRNSQVAQGINLQRINVKLRIPGANRFRDLVPTRNGWPLACRQYRKTTFFSGVRLEPAFSPGSSSNSGAPNVAFEQLLPLLSPQVMDCLHSTYGALSTSVFSSLQVVFSATARGIADNGDHFTSNTIQYTLTLRHLCGNGRPDDGEECDPELSPFCSAGLCQGEDGDKSCSDVPSLRCFDDSDCVGTCQAPGSPVECTCLF